MAGHSLEEVLVKCINTLGGDKDIDIAIEELLEIIGGFYAAERAYIFEFEKDMVHMTNTYEWCKDGVAPAIDRLKEIPISVVSRWFKYFRENSEVIISSVEEEVPKDTKEYEILAVQDIESLFAVPVYSDEQELIGFIGVDNPRESMDSRLILHSAGALIANNMQKRVTIEKKALKALGDLYVSMHIINLSTDDYIELACNESGKNYISGAGNSAEQIKVVMSHLSSPKYKQVVLSFVDLSTLHNRMRAVNHISCEYQSSEGRWRRAHFIAVDRTEQGELNNVIYAVERIDEEKQKELDYQAAQKQAWEDRNAIYGELLYMQSGGVVATDADTDTILVANTAALQMFGFVRKEDVGGDFSVMRERVIMVDGKVFDEEEQTEYEERKQAALRDGTWFTCEFAVDAGDEIVYILNKTKQITLVNGEKINVSSMTDISRQKELEHQLLLQSRTDSLTGLCNRGYGERCIEEKLLGGEKGMFCLLDIDKFKSINDTYDHAAGDYVLMVLAEAMQDVLRKDDIAMRLDGDEFAMFISGVESREEGEAILDLFFENLKHIQLEEIGGRDISVSLGAVLCATENMKRFETIYKRADSAMYICKSDRDKRYHFFN